MTHPVRFCLLGYIFICGCADHIQTAYCPQPDVPASGYYAPKQRKFEPGDEIIYSCKKGFALSGEERRVCKSNGIWSGHSPFCDSVIPLENPSVEDKDVTLPLVDRIIDDNNNTCFEWSNPKGKHLYVHFAKKMVIGTVKIYFKRGSTGIQVLTGLNNNMTFCADYVNFLETSQWITIKCRKNVIADRIKILVTEKDTFIVCEIKVYGRTDDSCEKSPNIKIQNGYFEVGRSKAVLFCNDGFRSGSNSRLVCEGNNTWTGGRLLCDEVLCDPVLSRGQSGVEWTFLDTTKKLSVGASSQIRCIPGYQKVGGPDTIFCEKNGTWTKSNATCIEEKDTKQKMRGIILGSVAIVVIVVILSLLAAIIYFIRKQRSKEVVVLYQQSGESALSALSSSERECASPHYEIMDNRPPELPLTPRPLAKLSTMSKAGETSTNWKGVLGNNRQQFDVDGAFGTMKSSTIYGS